MIARGWTGLRRGAAIFAAVLALALNVFVPQGFMPGTETGRALVLCTGNGPVLIASDIVGSARDSGSHTPKSKADGPCAFAGHGAAPPLATGAVLASDLVRWSPAVDLGRQSVLPRPSLAAPPPPSQAPPFVLI